MTHAHETARVVGWETVSHTDGRVSAHALLGRWRLSVWDHAHVRPDAAEPVRWYVALDGLFFGHADGAAATKDAGQAAAIAAAEDAERQLRERLASHEERAMDEHWGWPAGVTIVLFHWSWADGSPDDLVHGWSQQAETDAAGYVHLEAEDGEPPATRQVDPDGLPSTRRHTFRSAGELPGELRGLDGLPLPWIRALLDARAAR